MQLQLKRTVARRIAAKIIDIVLIVTLGATLPAPLGMLLGLLYSLLADGFRVQGYAAQSLGKKIMKLQVWNKRTQSIAGVKDSIVRNLPVGIAVFFSLIPIWGWIISALMGLLLGIVEIYLMSTVGNGRRLGDVMADTEVVSISQ